MRALTQEIYRAFSAAQPIAVPPSRREAGLTLEEAYAVEAELANGRAVVGRKVGFANKALWRVMKLETLVWASMYEDTVSHDVEWKRFGYSLKIEPEIVMKFREPVARGSDAAAVLAAAEWVALGFEIIDCPYPDWQFSPADFVATFGLHRKLFVGTPQTDVQKLVNELTSFRLKLFRNGELAEEGAGKNSLKSPALCVAELGAKAGEIVSTGTLTSGSFIQSGETWHAETDILPVAPIMLRLL